MASARAAMTAGAGTPAAGAASSHLGEGGGREPGGAPPAAGVTVPGETGALKWTGTGVHPSFAPR